MNNLPETIKTLLKAKNLKQKDLALRMGVKPSSVNQWLKGTSRPDNSRLAQLAKELGVTVDELLGGGGYPLPEGPPSGFFTDGNIASVRPNIQEFYTYVPFLSVRAQAGIPLMNYDSFTLDWIEETYPVFLPVIALSNRHLIIEIAGDSMEPEIKERAVVLAEAVKKEDIKYESGGVYAVLYGGSRFVVKRIKTNDLNANGTLTLWSDNEKYGRIVVNGDDILYMWKIIEKVREAVR